MFKKFLFEKKNFVVVALYTEKELTRKYEKRVSKEFCFGFAMFIKTQYYHLHSLITEYLYLLHFMLRTNSLHKHFDVKICLKHIFKI